MTKGWLKVHKESIDRALCKHKQTDVCSLNTKYFTNQAWPLATVFAIELDQSVSSAQLQKENITREVNADTMYIQTQENVGPSKDTKICVL